MPEPSKPTEIIGYWFAAGDELPNGDGRKVVIGETLTVEPPIVPCERGLHASVDPLDALQYARGPILYKVRLSGEIVAHDNDKHAASERTALAKRDATKMVRTFGRKAALSVIHLWGAPPVVREYLETGDESKAAAAYTAANAIAWASPHTAARDAAWAAVKASWKSALWEVDRDAIWGAARDASNASDRDAGVRSNARELRSAKTLFSEMVAALFDQPEQQLA